MDFVQKGRQPQNKIIHKRKTPAFTGCLNTISRVKSAAFCKWISIAPYKKWVGKYEAPECAVHKLAPYLAIAWPVMAARWDRSLSWKWGLLGGYFVDTRKFCRSFVKYLLMVGNLALMFIVWRRYIITHT